MEHAPYRMCRILIVEDEFLVAMDMEMQLIALGHNVVGTADTGEEALSLAEVERPDLVLMDVNLRGPMDGVEAAMRLRQVGPVPVVFVTAFGNEDILRRLRAVSSYEVLMKPYRPEDLQRVIATACHSSEQAIKPTIVIAEDNFLMREGRIEPLLRAEFTTLASVDNGQDAPQPRLSISQP